MEWDDDVDSFLEQQNEPLINWDNLDSFNQQPDESFLQMNLDSPVYDQQEEDEIPLDIQFFNTYTEQ